MKRISRALLCVPLALAACDTGNEAGGEAAKSEDQALVATKSDAEVPTWLSHTDPTEPARWLANREIGRPAAEVGSRAEHLRHSLARAKEVFIEDPRMMANRIVQLGEMLAEAGKPEPYADLLDGLEEVAAATHRKQLFGEMCQHYYNTRQQGADRATTLARLKERYSLQDEGRAPREREDRP